jgi:diamine N-acetyltransferase
VLRGKIVRLRAPERSDLPAFVRWFNDAEVTEYLLRGPPLSMEQEEHWYDGLLSRESKVFSIDTLDGKLIGNVGVQRIDYSDRKADIGIVIGEKDFWSKGYGTDALTVLLGYLFDELNMERVSLFVDSRNKRAYSCYRKVGFKREGVMRHDRWKDGVYVDDIMMSVLRSEWREKHPLKK